MANLSIVWRLLLKNQKAAEVPLTVRGAASQSGNLVELQDSSKNVLYSISAAGVVAAASGINVPTGKTAVVTDADSLTVGGVIVPQGLEITYRQQPNGELATEAFFIANRAYKVTAIREVHSTAGSDTTPPTLSVSKDTGTAAPGAGTGLLTAGLSLHATANTVQSGTLSATSADLTMAAGDRLAVVFTGTLTALAGVVVTVSLKRV